MLFTQSVSIRAKGIIASGENKNREQTEELKSENGREIITN